jgi:uncharacterized membrane protein (UPF0127 family)
VTDLLILLLVSAWPFACDRPAVVDGPPGGPAADTVKMVIGKDTFTLEIADEPREYERGLMERKSMPHDHGMIFVFPIEEPRTFWMKNTLIPLDIIYLDSVGRVLAVKAMVPLDLGAVGSDGPAMYAIEVNQGATAQAGVRRGDAVVIPPEIRARQQRSH